jgi:hypothetical protein
MTLESPNMADDFSTLVRNPTLLRCSTQALHDATLPQRLKWEADPLCFVTSAAPKAQMTGDSVAVAANH